MAVPNTGNTKESFVLREDRMSAEDANRISGESRVFAHDVSKGPQHSQGGVTTRHDATDLGVAMLPGDPAERQGPEDALGIGPKRGDYRDRIGPSSYHPYEIRPNTTGNGPAFVADAQRPRAEEIGDAPRLKGGVDTHLAAIGASGAAAGGSVASPSAEPTARAAEGGERR